MSKWNEKLFERIAQYSIKDKANALNKHCLYMLDKLQSLIDIKGLPLTMPKRVVVNQLLINGFTFITEHEDNLYAFYGGLGGEPNANYDPTIATISNPALKLSKSYVIDEEGILVRNDSHMLGVIPILCKYGTLDAEIMITFRLMTINNRISALINADDDEGYESAKQFLKDIEDGKLGVIQSSGFFDGVTTNDFSNRAGDIKDMIELSQYLRAQEWEEFGININGNMKREYVNDSEMNMSEPAVLPFISNMLENWREGFDKVNAFYGTEIEVDFTPLISYIKEKENENEEQESSSETEGVISEGTNDDDVKIYEVGEDKEGDTEGERGTEDRDDTEEEENKEDTEVTDEVSDETNEEATEEIAEDYNDITEEEIVEATEALNSDTVESQASVENDAEEEEGEDEDGEKED